MTILPAPHASPLPSWASRPNIPTARQPTFSAALRSIIRCITNRQPRPKSELQLQEKIVALLAQELEENAPPVETSLNIKRDKSQRPEG